MFSPRPRAWDNPKLLEYFDALAKLPDMLGRPVDPLPEINSPFQRAALRLAALTVLIIAAIALSPFWAPQVEQLFPWGGKPPATEQDYATLAARLTEIEKRPALSSFDVDAIKSAESALSRRVRSAGGGAGPSAGPAKGSAGRCSCRPDPTGEFTPHYRATSRSSAGSSEPAYFELRRSRSSWRAATHSFVKAISRRRASSMNAPPMPGTARRRYDWEPPSIQLFAAGTFYAVRVVIQPRRAFGTGVLAILARQRLVGG